MSREVPKQPALGAFGVGATLGGRYELKRELGRGGAAAVFAAEHLFIRRSFALKLAHADTGERDALFARLRRELTALSRVRHPAVVDLVDGGDIDGIPFIAMQLLEGRTLSGLVAARGQLSPDEVIRIGVELCSGLAAVHDAGIVHRDVKPSNVLVTPDRTSQAKLIDFGTAKMVDESEGAETKLTQHGALLGTPEYMAPEALLSLPGADHRVDVYSLGVTLYECLTGAVPFDGPIGQILMRLTASDAPSLSEKRSDVPNALAASIHRSLRREPAERFETIAEFGAALAACASKSLGAVDVLGGSIDGRVSAAPEESRPKTPEAQRAYARAPYVALARFAPERGVPVDGRIEDVSEGGVLLLAAVSCNAGEVVKLRFALPISGTIIDVPAKVRWSRATRGVRATGFEFTELPEPVRLEIKKYVRLMGRRPLNAT